jgi:hypothetical protein
MVFLFSFLVICHQIVGWCGCNEVPIRNENQRLESSLRSKLVSRVGHETIHRFFDTSALSPSEGYVAVTELPSRSISPSLEDRYANITLYNVLTNEHEVIDRTLAWSSQLGAQLQWGATDNELFYNTLLRSPSCLSSVPCSSYDLKGVVYHVKERVKEYLSCPVYHVSLNGKFTVSPDLLKVSATQKGYGIDWIDLKINSFASDAVMGNDVEKGTCSVLYSLKEVAESVGIDSNIRPTYSFHTKWSTDSKYIMFVMRTIEKGIPITSALSIVERAPKVRVQHLFILRRGNKKGIRYILSWASKPFLRTVCSGNGSCLDEVVVLRDGNHPNWVPHSLKITMNLERNLYSSSDLMIKNRKKEFSTVLIDLDKIYHFHVDDSYQFRWLHQNFSFHSVSYSTNKLNSSFYTSGEDGYCANLSQVIAALSLSQHTLNFVVLWEESGGHPSIDATLRYLLTDSYSKEITSGTEDAVLKSPIILVDLYCRVKYLLTEVFVLIFLFSIE